MRSRMDYLEKLLDMHKKYEPYQKVNAEYWKLKKAEETKGKGGILGFAKKSVAEEFKKTHQTELTTYRMYRDVLKRRDIRSGTSVRMLRLELYRYYAQREELREQPNLGMSGRYR